MRPGNKCEGIQKTKRIEGHSEPNKKPTHVQARSGSKGPRADKENREGTSTQEGLGQEIDPAASPLPGGNRRRQGVLGSKQRAARETRSAKAGAGTRLPGRRACLQKEATGSPGAFSGEASSRS